MVQPILLHGLDGGGGGRQSFACSCADAASWLHPLSGMRLVAEVGIQGAHAAVLSEMLLELAELAYEKVQNNTSTDMHDEDHTNTDEVNPVLSYSPFSQLNFGDVDGLELTVRAVGELGLNLGKEISDLVVREWWKFVFPASWFFCCGFFSAFAAAASTMSCWTVVSSFVRTRDFSSFWSFCCGSFCALAAAASSFSFAAAASFFSFAAAISSISFRTSVSCLREVIPSTRGSSPPRFVFRFSYASSGSICRAKTLSCHSTLVILPLGLETQSASQWTCGRFPDRSCRLPRSLCSLSCFFCRCACGPIACRSHACSTY